MFSKIQSTHNNSKYQNLKTSQNNKFLEKHFRKYNIMKSTFPRGNLRYSDAQFWHHRGQPEDSDLTKLKNQTARQRVSKGRGGVWAHPKTIHFPKGKQHFATVGRKALGGVSSTPIYGISMANRRLGLSATHTSLQHHYLPKVTFLNRSGWDLLAGNRQLGEAPRNDTECHNGCGFLRKT